MRPRILALANQLLFQELVTGGEKLFVEIAKRWCSKAVLTIFTSEVGCNRFQKEGVDAHYVTTPTSMIDNVRLCQSHPFYIFLSYVLRTFEAIQLVSRKTNYDIVYTTGDFFCNTIPASLLKVLNKDKKWIAVIHHINEAPGRRRGNPYIYSLVSCLVQRLSFFLIKKSADKILLLNYDIKKKLVDAGFDESRLFVVGAGVDSEFIAKVKASESDKFEACFVGRLTPTKGIFYLPKIWASVVDKIPYARIAVIGSSDEYWTERLKKRIESANLSNNILLLGFLSEEKKISIMKSSKIFVSLSYEEGWGMSINEALACGLPAVAWDLEVYKQIFKDFILIVPVGNAKAFSDAVLHLLTNKRLRERMVTNALRIARLYSLDSLAEKELKLIT